jgi:hypothetical protein
MVSESRSVMREEVRHKRITAATGPPGQSRNPKMRKLGKWERFELRYKVGGVAA